MTQEHIYKFALETAGKLIEKLETEVSLLRTLNESADRYSITGDCSVEINEEDKVWQEILKPDKVVKEGWIVVSNIDGKGIPGSLNKIFETATRAERELYCSLGEKRKYWSIRKITYEE